ncbi:MarR family winged helix-turn-helix transcriptional regulator [Kitasatospora sp. NPDC007106]|uniref:MarR family winged helix-turn-helix transcriptional regulator n=1 Tax=Kitasatospora sp. NPDC007106 TaxID=3156914 RepID=UPI0033F9BE94
MHSELQELGRAVKRVQYRQHRALETGLAAVGTTLAQWDALRAVGRQPGASARTLAAETFQTEQAFGTLAGRLVAQGLIERTPGHGRRIDHRLTPAGERMLEAGRTVAEEVLADCYADLPTADRTALLGLLHRVLGEEPA